MKKLTDKFPDYLFEPHILFINANDSFDNPSIGQVKNINEREVEILWYTHEIKDEYKGILRYSVEEFYEQVDTFIIVERGFDYKQKDRVELLRKLSNWYLIVNRLYDSPMHRLPIKECIDLVKSDLSLNEKEACSVLKFRIAQKRLDYIKNTLGEFIGLSHETLSTENKKRYLSSISNEIQAKSERINYVIRHGQTVGNYREELFISVLRKYVPKKFHVATGFIEGSDKQIDIIIYDQHNFLPVFREDDLVVVKKESVAAVIEIKTTLSRNTLLNSLHGLSKIEESGMNSIPFFKGIFAFDTDMSAKQIERAIADHYSNFSIDTVFGHLEVLCVPHKHCYNIYYDNLDNDEYSRPTLYELSYTKGINVLESFFFQKLFSYLEVDKTAKQINRLYFQELSSTAISKPVKILSEQEWIPIHAFISESSTTEQYDLDSEFDDVLNQLKQNVKDRVKNVQKWSDGSLDRESLIELYHNL